MTNIQPEFPLVWDSTLRGAYVSCPMKFFWEFMRKLGPNVTSVHLHFGAAIAAGLEVSRYRFYADNYSQEDAVAAGLVTLMQEWGDYEDNHDLKSFANCVAAYTAYCDEYPFGSDHIQPYFKDDGTPAVEFSFAIPIPEVLHPVTGEPLIYAGRFDMLGVYNSQLFIVDEKTTGQLGNSWLRNWDLRAQFTGYCWAAQEYGLPVAGAVVRGIAPRKNGSVDFAQAITYRPEHLISTWRQQLGRDLQRAVQNFKDGYWDVNFDSTCASYGGCQYKMLCESPEPEAWIPGYFKERTWNPLLKDPLVENLEPKDGILL